MAARPRKVMISIDWDFFFPLPAAKDLQRWLLFDWGHRETPFFHSALIWEIRAHAFARAGLPLPRTSAEATTFWHWLSDRVDLRHVMLETRESHVDAFATVVHCEITHVINFDAHHDCGYTGKRKRNIYPHARTEEIDCGDWLGVLATEYGVEATVIYPAWRTDCPERRGDADGVRYLQTGRDVISIDKLLEQYQDDVVSVFVCRSGAWTPTWIDGDFARFVSQAPGLLTTDVPERREFNLQRVQQLYS